MAIASAVPIKALRSRFQLQNKFNATLRAKKNLDDQPWTYDCLIKWKRWAPITPEVLNCRNQSSILQTLYHEAWPRGHLYESLVKPFNNSSADLSKHILHFSTPPSCMQNFQVPGHLCLGLWSFGSFRKLGVPYPGVLIILYSGPLFSETPI